MHGIDFGLKNEQGAEKHSFAQFSKEETRTWWMDIFYLLDVLSISHWCL